MHTEQDDRGRRIAIAAVVVLTGLTLATPARAVEVFRYQSRGQGALAFGVDYDEAGCVYTEAWLTADTSTTRWRGSGGRPDSTAGPMARVSVNSYECDTFEPLSSVYCEAYPLMEGEFQIVGKNLDAATLNAPLECVDHVNDDAFILEMDVRWTALGSPQPYRDNQHAWFPGYHYHYQASGLSRDAEVTAKGLYGGEDLLAAIASWNARINKHKFANTSVVKPLGD